MRVVVQLAVLIAHGFASLATASPEIFDQKSNAVVQPDVQPAMDLITRNYGSRASNTFQLSLNPNAPPCKKAPCFSLKANSSTVELSASGVSELTYGIGYYTRFYCGLSVGWKNGGGSYSKPANLSWPCHQEPFDSIDMSRAVPYTYEDNVCTHSYSYVWYSKEDWTRHIDWMALSGVNVFLAMTGQEEIQYKTFLQFNLTDLEIRNNFFNGPAFLTWSRGQNIQGVGMSGPLQDQGLPRSWMQSQWRLQKFILSRARSLGLIGVLPAFQGNMPESIKALHTAANISLAKSITQPGLPTTQHSAWVASTDPLFGKVADVWMETLLADFGTDHWYQCDGFFTGLPPPWYDEKEPLLSTPPPTEAVIDIETPVEPDPGWSPVWKAAWGGMSRTDPKARWLYQGWAIRGWNDRAGASRLRALFEAVPKGQWIPLDMDINGIWKYFGNYSFFGAPFIWTTLHNMGGNDGLKGDMRLLSGMPSAALDAGASIIGTGATPEGIDQNPAYYEYVYDTAWHRNAQPLGDWFANYASRRYGNTANPSAVLAWQLLLNGTYNTQAGGWHDDTGVEWSVITAPNRPSTSPTSIDIGAVYKAWRLFVSTGQDLTPVEYETLNYDIVNTGREVLAQLITQMEYNLTIAFRDASREEAKVRDMSFSCEFTYNPKPYNKLEVFSRNLLEALADLDELVGCDQGFLLGSWVEAAKKWSNNSDAPATYYEWQALSQVSTWWPVAPAALKHPETLTHEPTLDSYANKHWNGLIRDFYTKRIECYVHQIDNDLVSGPDHPTMNITNLTSCVVKAEYIFTQQTGTNYAAEATPSKTLGLSAELIAKYQSYFI